MHLSNGILFVCTGNTCRGVLAEHLGRERLESVLGPNARITSAGIQPQAPQDTANAVDTLRRRFALDASHHQPTNVHSVDHHGFDLVVSIDDPQREKIARAVQALGVPADRHVRWHILDPWGGDPTEYDAAALAICKALSGLRKHLEAHE